MIFRPCCDRLIDSWSQRGLATSLMDVLWRDPGRGGGRILSRVWLAERGTFQARVLRALQPERGESSVCHVEGHCFQTILDFALLANLITALGQSDQRQRVRMACHFCNSFCLGGGMRPGPPRLERYRGILCDSGKATCLTQLFTCRQSPKAA